MKLLTRSSLTSAILLTSTFSLIQSSSPANAQIIGDWVREKEIFTPSPTFPERISEADCYDFSKFNTCYKGYKH